MSALVSESGTAPVTLAEARDWLRLGPGDADAAVAALIRSAASLCEAFTGQMLIVREVSEERWAEGGWMRLARGPVAEVIDVVRWSGGGDSVAVPRADWSEQRLGDGAVAVRLVSASGSGLVGGLAGGRVRLRYRAGLADDANHVPEALRQGMLRLVQHWHFAGQEDVHLPAIVVALWTPWRRVSLGARP